MFSFKVQARELWTWPGEIFQLYPENPDALVLGLPLFMVVLRGGHMGEILTLFLGRLKTLCLMLDE